MNTFERPQIKKAEFREKMTEGIKTNKIRVAAPDLFKLAQKVVEGGAVYDLVLSDDASGRLVSLFLKKVLDGVKERRGSRKTDIRFVASGQHNNIKTFEAIEELLKKISPVRILLVTEFIVSGESIKKLTLILKKLNLRFDLATLSSREGGMNNIKDSLASNPDAQFYFGDISSSGLNFYGSGGREMSGVSKSDESPFPQRNISSHIKKEHKKEMQQKINQARKDIDLLAQETLKELGIHENL